MSFSVKRDFLMIFVLCDRGMICIGLKLFHKALELLHNVHHLTGTPSFDLIKMYLFNMLLDDLTATAIFLLQVVTAPMQSMNAIAVEAYKKYILVSLIYNGQVCDFFYLLKY